MFHMGLHKWILGCNKCLHTRDVWFKLRIFNLRSKLVIGFKESDAT